MASRIRTGAAAVAWAKGQVKRPLKNWHNLCLQFTRYCFNVAAVYPNAKKGWEGTKKKHKTTVAASIPAGVPVWFQTSTVNWHVALSAGGGMCYSSDVPRGKIGLIGIDALCKSWGIKLLGWSEDINGVTIYKAAKKIPFPAGIGPDKKRPSARNLQKFLKKAGFMAKSVVEADNYGPKTKTAVIKFHDAYPSLRSPGMKGRDNKIGPKGWDFLQTNW